MAGAALPASSRDHSLLPCGLYSEGVQSNSPAEVWRAGLRSWPLIVGSEKLWENFIRIVLLASPFPVYWVAGREMARDGETRWRVVQCPGDELF